RAILEFQNALRLQPKNAEPYYELGLASLAQGNYRGAYQNLLAATELDPGNVKAQRKLAEVIGLSVGEARDTRQLQAAEKRVEGILAIIPDSGEALGSLGTTEYLLGQPEAALKHLEAALEKVPHNVQAARSIAMIKIQQKDFAGAEQVLRKL